MKKYLIILAGLMLVYGLANAGITRFPNGVGIGSKTDTDAADVTVGDDDLFVKGTAEVDGATRLDGGLTLDGAVVVSESTTYSAITISTEIASPSRYEVIVSSGGDITSTATPFISTSTVTQGTVVTLIGGSSDVITLQDNGTLAGSLLSLGAATRALAEDDTLTLYLRDDRWIEISYSDNQGN